MRQIILGSLMAFLLLAALPQSPLCAKPATDLPATDLPAQAALDLAVLRAAYPGAVQHLQRNPDGQLELVLTSGQRLMYDDGRTEKAAADTGHAKGTHANDLKANDLHENDVKKDLAAPDLRTMLAQIYPLGPVNEQSAHPAQGFDPGRARVQELFTALYGATEAQVRKHCTPVTFDGHTLPFNARFGAAQALTRVWQRIAALLPQHPEFLPVLRPLGETLVWRVIAGTNRLSMHSFGIALDVNPDLPYWRWEKHPETMPDQCKAFPPEILDAFETEGFIWGGKWASFDLMHFEYRPELILKARALAGQVTLP
ncbi:MAG: M15 family metallopeptidase [Humidesulfovibrio sp.]|nr:M15 family metallopeptidase [Humidesulfovibrio sp.]